MFEQDYLMRLLYQLAAAIRRSLERATSKRDPHGAAELLEAAVGEAVDLDGETLLSLTPESMASILQVSGTDPRVVEYVARSLSLVADYYAEDGNVALSDLRRAQARSLAESYGYDLDVIELDPESIEAFLDEAEAQNGV